MAPSRRTRQTENSGEASEARRAGAQPSDRPTWDRPTWRGAALRGLVAGIALALLAGLILKATAGETLAYFAVALLAYTPISYYTDRWIYWRHSKKAAFPQA
jgi:hypothetical protein